MLPISTVTRFSQAAGASKPARGRDGDFCFRAKPRAGSPVPEAALTNAQPLALPGREKVTGQAPGGWQSDPHVPIHSSLQKVCPTQLQGETFCVPCSGWLGNWKSRGSPERLQECCRCGMSTKSVSPRLNRPSRPILPWAFEGYRLWNNLWSISTTTLALDLKHPETGGQRFPSVVHKQPAPTHSQESRGSDSSSAPNVLTGEQSSSGGYLPFFAKLLLYSLGEDAQGFR